MKLYPRERAIEVAARFKEVLESPLLNVAGSIRREHLFVKDIDVVVLYGVEVVKRLDELGFNQNIGTTLRRGVFAGIPIDVFLATTFNVGAMLLFATGSSQFNIQQRLRARRLGLKLNQNGLFNWEQKLIASVDENGIFNCLKSSFISPQERD